MRTARVYNLNTENNKKMSISLRKAYHHMPVLDHSMLRCDKVVALLVKHAQEISWNIKMWCSAYVLWINTPKISSMSLKLTELIILALANVDSCGSHVEFHWLQKLISKWLFTGSSLKNWPVVYKIFWLQTGVNIIVHLHLSVAGYN